MAVVGRTHNLDGQLLAGRYLIRQRIGAGGMANVYLAQDTQKGIEVALKVLHPQFAEDPSSVERFHREPETTMGWSHPHIVRVLDHGEDQGLHYLAMDFVRGQNLKQYLMARGSLPAGEAIALLRQILGALQYAAARGVVHRDIKPQNILIGEDGKAKVTDFGIARLAAMATLTRTGMFLGSPHYVSPEQAQGLKADTRADVYSAGIVMYEMLTGKVPFDAETPWAVINMHVAQAPSLDHPKIPRELRGVLAKALAKEPAQRFPSPAAMAGALARAGARIRVRRLLSKWAKPAAAVAAALVLLAAGLGLMGYRERQERLAAAYERGIQALQGRNWAGATAEFQAVLTLDPGYRDAPARLQLAQRQERAAGLYRQGLSYLAQGDLRQAQETLAQAADLYPEDAEIAAQRKEIADLSLAWARAKNYLDSGLLEAARGLLGPLLERVPLYREGRALMVELDRQKAAEEQARQALAEKIQLQQAVTARGVDASRRPTQAVDPTDRFRPQDTVYFFVRWGVLRDGITTYSVAWVGPDGLVRWRGSTGPVTEMEGYDGWMAPSIRAGELDGEGTGQSSFVSFYADGVRLATVVFRVVE